MSPVFCPPVVKSYVALCETKHSVKTSFKTIQGSFWNKKKYIYSINQETIRYADNAKIDVYFIFIIWFLAVKKGAVTFEFYWVLP